MEARIFFNRPFHTTYYLPCTVLSNLSYYLVHDMITINIPIYMWEMKAREVMEPTQAQIAS